jgi:hypothetical protein
MFCVQLKIDVASKLGVPLQQVALSGWPDAAHSTNDQVRIAVSNVTVEAKSSAWVVHDLILSGRSAYRCD